MAKARLKKPKSVASGAASQGAVTGYESEMWAMADALRGSMDASEYKHVVLGLIFLKYISDAFEERHAQLTAEQAEGADPEDPDEYRAENVFWVPLEARWAGLQDAARQPDIGEMLDDAMHAIEHDNPVLAGVLPKDYARPELDKVRLGQLIDMVGDIRVGDAEARSKDVLLAFYDALETNDSAVKVLGDETLRAIACELVETVRNNVAIDWTMRENVRAKLRTMVRRILRRHGYPPDKQEKATKTVLEQAEALSAAWATAA